MQRAPVSCLGLYPDTLLIDGQLFYPIAHFNRAGKATSDRKAAHQRRDALVVSIMQVARAGLITAAHFRTLALNLNSQEVKTVKVELE
jgi:hypothetical protein